ncbi:hypothetical protein [Weissella cibaria]|nr:hypothetical protein [Weissella cibaria]MBZ6069197.1 hypothetical protein [Weissella cibaria]
MGFDGDTHWYHFLQRFGWYQSVKKQVNVMQIIGIIIMVADVIMMQLQ